MSNKYNETIAFLKPFLNEQPETGIVLGTGLGGLVKDIQIRHQISYAQIPHFPLSTVESHQGYLIIGTLAGKEVLVMQGRFHYYEGYDMEQITYPIRIMALLGIKKLMISNAAGGLNPDFEIGELMLIHDHINLFPENPLRGHNNPQFGPRFPDMSEPYSFDFIKTAEKFAQTKNMVLHKGVYAGVQGPCLETRAEYKYLRTICADAVGMSSIPENIVARHMGLTVFAVSVITDKCVPDQLKPLKLEEVLAAAQKAEPSLIKLFHYMIGNLN
jgi:purine-nucleoside phosphorylase